MSALWSTTAMTFAMAATNVLGSVALKLSAEPQKEQYFAAGIIAYVVGAVLYVSLLKENSIAVLAVASSTLQLGLMISMSVWFFDERVNLVQGSAMAIAVLAATIAMLAATH